MTAIKGWNYRLYKYIHKLLCRRWKPQCYTHFKRPRKLVKSSLKCLTAHRFETLFKWNATGNLFTIQCYGTRCVLHSHTQWMASEWYAFSTAHLNGSEPLITPAKEGVDVTLCISAVAFLSLLLPICATRDWLQRHVVKETHERLFTFALLTPTRTYVHHRGLPHKTRSMREKCKFCHDHSTQSRYLFYL